MQKRMLGKTGEQVSILGLGGFHLLEISTGQANQILNRYLDAGGNYIETSASYGNGESERKISKCVDHRRNEFYLATKVDERDNRSAMRTLESSLHNLWTDYIDLWFMHAVQTEKEAERLLAPGGALEAAEKAKRQGKIRYVGITGHGQPFGLLRALKEYAFDALMVPVNYYDRFNFPDIFNKLLPLAQERNTAVIGMKAMADGYLWRSSGPALRYALSQPLSMVVAGINTPELLKQDLESIKDFSPMYPKEVEEIHQNAPEYRGYVCRQCPSCPADEELDLKRIFELEGWYDRQMWDGRVINPEDYSMRIRLGPWFGQRETAQRTYAQEKHGLDPGGDYSYLDKKCTYGLEIEKKLKIAHKKLTSSWSLY